MSYVAEGRHTHTATIQTGRLIQHIEGRISHHERRQDHWAKEAEVAQEELRAAQSEELNERMKQQGERNAAIEMGYTEAMPLKGGIKVAQAMQKLNIAQSHVSRHLVNVVQYRNWMAFYQLLLKEQVEDFERIYGKSGKEDPSLRANIVAVGLTMEDCFYFGILKNADPKGDDD